MALLDFSLPAPQKHEMPNISVGGVGKGPTGTLKILTGAHLPFWRGELVDHERPESVAEG